MKSSSEYAQMAEDVLSAAWEISRDTTGMDTSLPIRMPMAQTYATLAVAAALKEASNGQS